MTERTQQEQAKQIAKDLRRYREFCTSDDDGDGAVSRAIAFLEAIASATPTESEDAKASAQVIANMQASVWSNDELSEGRRVYNDILSDDASVSAPGECVRDVLRKIMSIGFVNAINVGEDIEFDDETYIAAEIELNRLRAAPRAQASPTMTDLMVTPESIGPYLEREQAGDDAIYKDALTFEEQILAIAHNLADADQAAFANEIARECKAFRQRVYNLRASQPREQTGDAALLAEAIKFNAYHLTSCYWFSKDWKHGLGSPEDSDCTCGFVQFTQRLRAQPDAGQREREAKEHECLEALREIEYLAGVVGNDPAALPTIKDIAAAVVRAAEQPQ